MADENDDVLMQNNLDDSVDLLQKEEALCPKYSKRTIPKPYNSERLSAKRKDGHYSGSNYGSMMVNKSKDVGVGLYLEGIDANRERIPFFSVNNLCPVDIGGIKSLNK